MRAHGDRAHELQGIERRFAVKLGVQRRALDLHEVVDRHRFRIRIEVGELRDEPRALRARLAHAHDAAAAHVDARVAHAVERVEPVLEVARA